MIEQFHQILKYLKPDPGGQAIKSGVPIGFTGQGCIWYAEEAPEGWLLCQGQIVSKDEYIELWLLLGDTWGTSTEEEFYLPDMRQRVPVGKHSSGTFDALNKSGGAEEHQHAAGKLSIPYRIDGGNTWIRRISDSLLPAEIATNKQYNMTWGGGGSASIDTYIRAIGDTALSSSLQPYRVVNFIIKT